MPMVFYTATREAAMTTHKNTLEGQCRRAPLNGLAIGTIVGAVWALVFLLWGVRGNFFMSVYFMSVVFPVVGWLTGLWGRTVGVCETPAMRKRKIRVIGAVMATFTGLIMAIHEHFISKFWGDYIPSDAIFSGKAVIIYLVPLIVFPIVGWMLGTVRANILHGNGTAIIRMSCVTVVAVFVSVIAWFYITASLSLFFLSFLMCRNLHLGGVKLGCNYACRC